MVKIIDKVNEKVAEGKPFFSFEYFPPRTEEGVEALFERQERMVAHGPVFCDITWGAGGSTADVTLDIATRMQTQICVDTMMHLTCTNMPIEKLGEALKAVKKQGIQNILALRGDPPKGQEKFEAVEGGFNCALDLVKYIRKEFGDYFGICVSGYPEAHPDTIVDDPVEMDKNYWENIAYLKKKIEAGAELIVTQLFYDVDIFFKFVKDCRSVGITVPILPGIMPIMTYGGFKRMTGFCKTKVPQDLADKIESLKDNEEALKAFGIEHGAEMCRKLLDGGVPGLHMYSLNLEATVLGILERVGFIEINRVSRSLPWKHIPMGTRRQEEGVRPIFWSSRSHSYVRRTQGWETYPKSRWGEQSSNLGSLPAPEVIRQHTVNDGRKKKAVEAWGAELQSVESVRDVFRGFYSGKISLFPWSDTAFSGPEVSQRRLTAVINKGMLPINLLAPVNAASSADATVGWGGPGGFVYQKGYLEAFVSPKDFEDLLPKLKASPNLTYLASNKAGDMSTSASASGVSAVSWGVFPGKEIIQPDILDKESFVSWKDEAFALWTSEWGNLYEPGSSSLSILQEIASSWYLVAILDNAYAPGDVFGVLGV